MKYLIISIVGLLIVILGFMALNTYFGWYAYEHWKYRKASTNLQESIKRGVFVRSLQYKIIGTDSIPFKFEPFIEKAFTWGFYTSDSTVAWKNTNYPYQFKYQKQPYYGAGIFMEQSEREKFDSSNYSWGYLKYPYLKDTITLIFSDSTRKKTIIKVW
jgi:hypothetical protein